MTLLNEREKTHGDFSLNAEASQRIKETIQNSVTYLQMSCVQREALDMIALKISRIISGKYDHLDHWEDIAGYANLVINHMEKNKLLMGLQAAKNEAKKEHDQTKIYVDKFGNEVDLSWVKLVPTGSGYCKCGNHFSCCQQCG